MADDALPLIAEKDYEAFMRIIKRDFPHAYEEWPPDYDGWTEFYKKNATECLLKGHGTRPVTVYPNEFREFCHDRYHDPKRGGTLHNLWLFAREMAAKEDEMARGNIEDQDE